MARWTTEAPRLLPAAAAGAAAALLCAPVPVMAEPWIALRTGNSCASCHTNQTGGGKRTTYGALYGLDDLPAWQAPLPEGREPLAGTVTRWMSVGVDYRGQNASRFAPSDTTNTFLTDEANLYTDFALIADRLRLYADVQLAPGSAQTREIFALVEKLPGRLYVKAGRFFPPYGWRIQDDTAYIRSRTGFNFNSPDDGLEIGWSPYNFELIVAATNGAGGTTDDNTNKRVSVVSFWKWKPFRAGLSYASNRQGEVSSKLGGIQMGAKMGPLVLLAELDGGRDEQTTTGAVLRRAIGFAEADLLVAKGWNLKGSFDYYDPDTDETGDEENRITAGVEWFAMNHTEVRFLWRRTDRPPEVRGVTFEDDREVILELHLFL